MWRKSNNRLFLRLIVALVIVLAIQGSIMSYGSIERFIRKTPITRSHRLVVRVTPDPGDVVDNLLIGKSCKYYKRIGRWQCRDCGLVAVGKGRYASCRKLKRKGICSPFRNAERDSPPQSASQFDPTSNETQDLRMLSFTSYLQRIFYENQPVCTVASCFDLTKCNDSSVINVYVNATGPHELLDYAVAKMNSSSPSGLDLTLKRVQHYQDACLLLVTKDTYNSVDALKGAGHWNGGRNTLLWDWSRFRYPDGKHLTSDAPFSLIHAGYAVIASESLPRAYLRNEYDIPLPLVRKWGRPVPPEKVDIHRPRKWLLSFRGRLQNTPHPYYQHRWLAAEYWEDEPDILVDVECYHVYLCGAIKTIAKPYSQPPTVYADLLWNSTFVFAPGGSGVGSYRFGEILSTGGIPVVTSDYCPPLHPEIDWSGCIVRVSDARIVDLPRILRTYTREQIRERQKICWNLLQTVLGDQKGSDDNWRSNVRTTFALTIRLMAIRISNAILNKQRLETILNKTSIEIQ